MNLHEYQGKSILSKYGVPIQEGSAADSVDEAMQHYDELAKKTGSPFAVIKAQIHAGGRGKGGGVKLAKNREEAKEHISNILGMQLKTPQTPGGMGGEGKQVNKILVAEDAYAPDFDANKEYYVSILMDRERKQNVIIHSVKGGMDIEAVAEETPELVHKIYIDPELGMQPFNAREVAFNLGLEGTAFKNMTKFIAKLYQAYVGADASLIEINPTLHTGDDRIVAVDCKFSVDDNALYRHKDIAEMRDTTEEDATEVEAQSYGLNFVNLGRQRRLHGQRRRSGHGHHGHHQTQRWRARQLPRRRGYRRRRSRRAGLPHHPARRARRGHLDQYLRGYRPLRPRRPGCRRCLPEYR